jgi:hypothetical protein
MQELVFLQSLVQVYDISLITVCLSSGQKLNPVMLVFNFGLDLKAKEDGAPVKIKLIVQSLLLFSLCTSCLRYRYFFELTINSQL